MKTVLVTGAGGFIGKNLCARLEQDGVEVLRFEKDNTAADLAEMVAKAEFVFHLAGVMRPKEVSEFDAGNRGLTEDVLELIGKSGRDIPVLLTSSIQAELDNPYGHSKKAAENAVFEWAEAGEHTVYVYRLPNVFGRWARPNYSSVVATFCYNIAHDIEIEIHDPAREMMLAYIDEVVDDFMEALAGRKRPGADGFCGIEQTYSATLQELADTIYGFKKAGAPAAGVPKLDKCLYDTYISYLDE